MFVSVPMANNSFGLGMQFVMKGYLEIKQEQAYTFTSLVGNVGGYMGLFLGYAILHFPKLLSDMINPMKRWCLTKLGREITETNNLRNI